jgi:hypothetical protein
MPLYPLKVLRTKECAPTPCFYVVFSLDSHLSPLRSFVVRQLKYLRTIVMTINTMNKTYEDLCK